MTVRVCGYIRVSTDKKSQQESYNNQIKMAVSEIKRHPGWKYVGIYEDPAYTGTKGDRPGFQNMMKDARAGKFDKIYVKSISRFARNTLLTLQKLKELETLGITVYFEKERIDTGGLYSEILLSIMSAFAQEESRNISERVKHGIRIRAENGEVSWTPVYGFDKKGNDEFVFVRDEVEIIKRIFREYERGEKQTDIAR